MDLHEFLIIYNHTLFDLYVTKDTNVYLSDHFMHHEKNIVNSDYIKHFIAVKNNPDLAMLLHIITYLYCGLVLMDYLKNWYFLPPAIQQGDTAR